MEEVEEVFAWVRDDCRLVIEAEKEVEPAEPAPATEPSHPNRRGEDRRQPADRRTGRDAILMLKQMTSARSGCMSAVTKWTASSISLASW